MRIIAWTLYVVLGGVFVWAGIAKLLDPSAFLSSILTYEIFPRFMAVAAALFVPYLELCVGFSLATGALRRGGRWLAIGMTLVFTTLLIQAAARGLDADCGCFGSQSYASEAGYTWPIARDILMLAGLAVAVAIEKRKK
jgi:putative oxidoreductase